MLHSACNKQHMRTAMAHKLQFVRIQIVVPVDLADVLKAFTKEVIRRQPENLVEFGAK